jgi:hypothetical protein
VIGAPTVRLAEIVGAGYMALAAAAAAAITMRVRGRAAASARPPPAVRAQHCSVKLQNPTLGAVQGPHVVIFRFRFRFVDYFDLSESILI